MNLIEEKDFQILPILVVPDDRLKTKCPKIPNIDTRIQKLAKDMIATMRDAHGIGLAGPQVGIMLRLIVCEVENQLHVIANPQLARVEGNEVGTEGCLSIPGYVGDVERAIKVVVKGKNMKGKDIRIKAEGLLARCFQHEIDHLDGILYTDKLISPKTFRKRIDSDEVGLE
jgi:peptide deformylase